MVAVNFAAKKNFASTEWSVMPLSLWWNVADVMSSSVVRTYSDMSSFHLEYIRCYICGYHMYRKGRRHSVVQAKTRNTKDPHMLAAVKYSIFCEIL